MTMMITMLMIITTMMIYNNYDYIDDDDDDDDSDDHDHDHDVIVSNETPRFGKRNVFLQLSE